MVGACTPVSTQQVKNVEKLLNLHVSLCFFAISWLHFTPAKNVEKKGKRQYGQEKIAQSLSGFFGPLTLMAGMIEDPLS